MFSYKFAEEVEDIHRNHEIIRQLQALLYIPLYLKIWRVFSQLDRRINCGYLIQKLPFRKYSPNVIQEIRSFRIQDDLVYFWDRQYLPKAQFNICSNYITSNFHKNVSFCNVTELIRYLNYIDIPSTKWIYLFRCERRIDDAPDLKPFSFFYTNGGKYVSIYSFTSNHLFSEWILLHGSVQRVKCVVNGNAVILNPILVLGQSIFLLDFCSTSIFLVKSCSSSLFLLSLLEE